MLEIENGSSVRAATVLLTIGPLSSLNSLICEKGSMAQSEQYVFKGGEGESHGRGH